MSSNALRKMMKGKVHRERGQLSSRRHLGLLEKRKDYKLRSSKYKQNQEIIKKLREKAYFRNPDEYYTRMKKLADRKDQQSDLPDVPEEERKLIETQSLTYLLMKQLEEKKRVEKMQQNLHLVNKKPNNHHVIFVDSTEEVNNFDPVKYFDTTPEGVNRTYNRPKLEMLKKESLVVGKDIHNNNHNQDDMDKENERLLSKIQKERRAQYTTLAKRINRQKELQRAVNKVELKRNLQDKTRKAKVVQREGMPDTYQWEFKRKG